MANGGTPDKIYYTINDGATLPTYHIDTDGSSNTKIYDHADGDGHYMDKIAVDSIQNKLYFSDGFDYKIYKANLDGTSRQQILDPGVWPDFMTAYKGYVYFTLNDWSDTINLWRVDSNGSNLLQITSLSHQMVQGIAIDPINDDLYYYVYDASVGANCLIYRIDNIVTPGSPALVGSSISGSLNSLEAYNGYVYYADASAGNLHRRYMDGNGDTVLYNTSATETVQQICVAPNQNGLYFFVGDSGPPTTYHTYYMTLPGAYTTTPSVFASFNNVNLQNMDIYYEPGPEMSVYGNGYEITDGDSSPSATDYTDFGGVNVNGATLAHNFVIYNTGSTALNLTDSAHNYVVIGGTNAGDFTLTTIPSSTVAAGGNTTFQITFDPSAGGTRTANISIANDDSNENPYNFSIQGAGLAPDINVKQGVTNIPDGTGSYNFGNYEVGTDTRATFTIENTGDVTLNITNVSIANVHPGDFSFELLSTTTVAPGGSLPFYVHFAPTTYGAQWTDITITSDDPDAEGSYYFEVHGQGTVAPVIHNLNGDTVNFIEGAGPVLLDLNGDATVTDADSTGYNSGYVYVTYTFDTLVHISIHQGSGVTLSAGMTEGSTVTVGTTLIGTISSFTGQGGLNLRIDLNANATNALISTLLQNITFDYDSQDPSGSKSVNFAVQDNFDKSTDATVTVNLVGVNDPPTLTATGNNPTFTEGGAHVDLYNSVSISTVESGQNIIQLIFTVTNVTDGINENITIDGSDVFLTDSPPFTTFINHLDAIITTSGTTVTVTLSKAGGIATWQMESVVNDLRYWVVGDNPTPGNRVFTITSIQDDGGID